MLSVIRQYFYLVPLTILVSVFLFVILIPCVQDLRCPKCRRWGLQTFSDIEVDEDSQKFCPKCHWYKKLPTRHAVYDSSD
jgi:hypothetical protein